jgi:hypothetical protein
MIPLAVLLCNYGRGFCLIDIGTEGTPQKYLPDTRFGAHEKASNAIHTQL